MVYGFLSLFLALGVYLTGIGVKDLWHGIASPGWPRVEGMVVPRQVEASHGSSASGEILVQYQVNGRPYVTDTIRFGKSSTPSDSSEAELQRLRYPVGQRVGVAYQPGDPAVAVLSPGFSAEALGLPGAGLVCALVAVMFGALFRGSSQVGGGMALGVSLFAAIFITFGLSLLIAGAVTLYRAHASTGWPSAEGAFVPEASGQVYRYYVEGRTRYSVRRRFGPEPEGGPEIPVQTEGEPTDAPKLRVRYDPSDPDLAVLETGITNEVFWLPGAGAVVLLFGLAVIRLIVPAMKRDF